MENLKTFSLLKIVPNSFSEIFTAFMAYKSGYVTLISLVFLTSITFYLILPFHKKRENSLFAYSFLIYFYRIAFLLINFLSSLSFMSLFYKSTYTQTLPGHLSFFSSSLIFLIFILFIFIITDHISKVFSKKTCFNIQIVSSILGIYFYSFLCSVIPIYFVFILGVFFYSKMASLKNEYSLLNDFNMKIKFLIKFGDNLEKKYLPFVADIIKKYSLSSSDISGTLQKLIPFLNECSEDGQMDLSIFDTFVEISKKNKEMTVKFNKIYDILKVDLEKIESDINDDTRINGIKIKPLSYFIKDHFNKIYTVFKKFEVNDEKFIDYLFIYKNLTELYIFDLVLQKNTLNLENSRFNSNK